jgi:hypothetical protein
MTPRIQLTAAPYAFNADKVDGMDASAFVQLSPGSQQTGNINVSGNLTAGGTYNGNTFTSSALTFSAASAASIQAANSQNLLIDSGSSGSVSIGTSNATAVTAGKNGVVFNAPGGINVNSGANVPTTDQLVIDNTSSTGVTAAGVNGLNVHYKGGSAAVEGAGMRVDYTPGTTSGGTWSGLRVIEGAASASGVTSYGLKLEGGGAGGGTDTALYVNSNWDIGLDLQSGGMQLAAQADPATPSGTNLRIYAKAIAGRVLPKWVGPSGVDTPFQPSFGFNRIALMTPQTGTTAATFTNELGGGFTNLCSSCSVPTLATTNLSTSVRRARFQTSTTAGNIAYHMPAAGLVWRGNAAGMGGFFFTTRFSFNATSTANRGFVGLVDNAGTAPTNVDPTSSTTPGKIGVAFTNNTGNLKWVNNVSGSAPTSTDLGSNFTVVTGKIYELVIYSPPNGGSITYRVQNITNSNVTSDTVVSTNIPANTTFLAPEFWMTNNTNGSAVSIESAGWYLESDN